MKLRLLPILMLAILSSCDVNQPVEFDSEYMVESYLFANEPLQELRLSRTVPFGTAYNFEEQAVGSATVVVSQLDDSGNMEASYTFVEDSAGIYLPPDSNINVLPRKTYALEISFPTDPTVLTATTIIPDSFSVQQVSGDTLVFASTEQLEIDVTQSFYPGRQNVFIFSTEALYPAVELFTPFFADIFDEEEDDLEDFRISESPLLNEGNYDINPDGTLTIKMPWLAISFFGPNRISIYAVDDNIFDFISSATIQTQVSTLSPGEIPNVIDPIEGGTGIFGSYARVSVDVLIVPELP